MHTPSEPPAPQLDRFKFLEKPKRKVSPLRVFVLGGALPVVAFALVENFYGTMGGLVAGIAFGVAEMAIEYFREKKIQGITIVSNGLVIILGGISLFENNDKFFKLQPSILLAMFGVMLIVSSFMKKPFLVALAKKQTQNLPELGVQRIAGLNWRLGIFMFFLALIGVHAAYAWTTANWAILKGIGVPAAMGVYVVVEMITIRMIASARQSRPSKSQAKNQTQQTTDEAPIASTESRPRTDAP